MITIEIGNGRSRGSPHQTATALGIREEQASKGPLGPLCRKLLAAGHPDQPWQATRDGEVVLSGRSIAWLAGRDCVETQGGGPRMVPWHPYPGTAEE